MKESQFVFFVFCEFFSKFFFFFLVFFMFLFYNSIIIESHEVNQRLDLIWSVLKFILLL